MPPGACQHGILIMNTILILDFGDGHSMKTLSELFDKLPEDAPESPLVIKNTNTGDQYTIDSWQFIQNSNNTTATVLLISSVQHPQHKD